MMFKIINLQFLLVQLIIAVDFTLTENISYKNVSQFSKEDNETFIIFEKQEKMFKTITKFLSQSSLPIMMEIYEEVNVSSSCVKSAFRFLSDLRQMKGWTIKMLDSIGKTAGTFSGTLWFHGDYDQCLDIEEDRIKLRKSNRDEPIYGRYCAVNVGFPKMNYKAVKRIKKFKKFIELINNMLEPFTLEKFIETANYKRMKYRFDICVPSSCNQNDINNIARWAIQDPYKVDVLFCKTKEEKMEFTLAQIICLITFGFFAVWVIFVTFIETLFRFNIFPHRDVKDSWLDCLFSTSMYASYEKLFNIRNYLEKTKFFCGIKFLIICTVVFIHILLFITTLTTMTEHIHNLKFLADDFPLEISSNGIFMIETFFFISGFLTLFFRRNNEKHSIYYYFIFIIKRFIRLTLPVFCVLAMIIILPLFGDGPHWEYVKQEGNKSAKYWWRFILHVQNLYDTSLDFTVHIWFLNVLMQLTVFTQPLLFIIDRWPKIGRILMCGFMLSGILSHIYYMLTSEYYTIVGISINVEKLENYCFRNYQKPYYTHLSSYCLGMLIGNILSKRKDMKIGKYSIISLWIGTLILIGLVLFGLHSYRTDVSPNEILIHIHQALSPIAWIAVSAWGSIACISGFGGILTKFLSLDIFVALDRLNLWIYLLHPLCILYIFGELRSPQELTEINLWMLFSLVMVLSMIASILFYMFLETPLNYISAKLFLPIRSKNRNPKQEEVSKL